MTARPYNSSQGTCKEERSTKGLRNVTTAAIDDNLLSLFTAYRGRIGDSTAAAMLTLAQTLAQLGKQSPAPSAALSVKDAAKQLGVSRETVYKLAEERVLPHTRIGRRIVISPEQLAAYQSSRRAG
jgi:excisionase family DNA binding protein